MDVVVVGAGMVGAACAYFCAEAGLAVTVVDRGAVASGTTSGGEGNILVSDKEPGAELDLALLSVRLWTELGERFGAESLELQHKGGVVVAQTPAAAAGLAKLAAEQRESGIDALDVSAAELAELEPNLTREVCAGAYYAQDMQVQPMLAAAELLRQARRRGATVHTGTEVLGFRRDRDGRIAGVSTSAGDLPARWVVNAAGTWGGELSALAGGPVPVLPRRGFVLVTEPLPVVVRHKVYTADYVANVASGDEGLETSVVVEGTRAGTVLIGASRERVGFDRTFSLPVVRKLAAQAIGVFPFLADVALLRGYLGFRPYCPDHLPVLGEDPRVPGLVHACGHEGAGIGLAAGTGHLVAQAVSGTPPDLDLAPFRPDRFSEAP
ncbi:FAD-binding oxidoreductase [Amycolatopsis acidiphila]|uniref:FAD-binding oxidoreductase n=1 Tax=Amycolatopsis acidiphila TaxID=715473 RepID=A0A558A749_9PSEU|nr:FAD-binding oxidoreductase [Amycolatopsis acidiphila]TVT20080.1 FAD-binding oxidoreductase [Amycolatopsis acidiphila]UIJ62901.1 FAD-binding oxidoreductase [Amycolatopsis acidiphila]GHG64929.1 oxidoreductase [Amycolatopsis acidiphila]